MFWLLVWAVVTRLPWLLSGTMLFGFDQGRDALAVLHLIKTLNPVFVGPWTSIQGLFFGPGWYYLLAPTYWIFQANPVAGPATIFLLYLGAIILAYRYLGKIEAAIFTTAPIWLQLSTGASNSFPMGLIGLLLIIGLKRQFQSFWLGLTIGLGFHFSSALAVLWLLIIPLLVKIKHWPKLALGLFVTFIPQLLFEVKNNWLEVRSVTAYFAAGESQHISLGKISTVNHSVLHEMALAVLPDINFLKISGLIILAVGTVYLIKQRRLSFWWPILLLTVIPTVGFWFLHYNPWYSYGLLPLAVLAVAKALRAAPKPLALLYLLLLLINSAAKTYQFETHDQVFLSRHKGFLTAKLTALNYIYRQANGRPFASYQYHPEIYDYAYQYLYIWQAFKGKPLPVDFSYQPAAPSYIPEKASLLGKLPTADGQPELIFLIIEQPDNIWHYPFSSWLKNIPYTEIVDKKVIGPELEVWTLTPRQNR